MSSRMIKARRAVRPALAEPRVRRAYFDCRYGQLHVRCAIPTGGGFDEATTLLCVPGSPGSGRFFQPLLPPLGRDRSVYAPDLPGCGESDPIPPPATNSEMATALADFLDSMHLQTIDLLAHEEGVAVALELLQQRPSRVGRVVLSPNSDVVRTDARALRQPVLVIDLRASESATRDPNELERQASELRDFLGLA